MQTTILSGFSDAQQINKQAVDAAADWLRCGEVVAIPTETVYGLAADTFNEDAVRKIFTAKGRPSDNPLIVHIADRSALRDLVTEIPKAAEKLADIFWPGPLTMILPKSDRVPAIVSPRLTTLAVRMPSHPVAQAVIRAAGVPLAAPSANRSGSPSPTDAQTVADDLNGNIPLILDGGACEVGVESTVITLCTPVPRVLRPGWVTVEDLRAVLGEVDVDDAVLHQLKAGATAASPGMKYKHYAPSAEVTIVRGDLDAFVRFMQDKDAFALCFSGEESLFANAVSYGAAHNSAEQANRLFSALRTLDAKGAKTVYARCPDLTGVGLAVYNRLIRSAAFRVIDAACP